MGERGVAGLEQLGRSHQHFRAAILLEALRARKGFRGSPWLDIDGTLQLLNSDHVRERDKALLLEWFPSS